MSSGGLTASSGSMLLMRRCFRVFRQPRSRSASWQTLTGSRRNARRPRRPNDERMKKCAITGAGGYIGSRLTHYFRQAGWIVYELKRNAQRATDSDEFSRPYSLEGPLDPSALVGLDALIHCAYDFRLTRAKDIWEVNVKGSLRLVAAARSAGLPRIVL